MKNILVLLAVAGVAIIAISIIDNQIESFVPGAMLILSSLINLSGSDKRTATFSFAIVTIAFTYLLNLNPHQFDKWSIELVIKIVSVIYLTAIFAVIPTVLSKNISRQICP